MRYFDGDFFPSTKGIYLIGFIGSDKVYVGSACAQGRSASETGFRVRWRSHIHKLKKNFTPEGCRTIKLQNAFNKYGVKNMYFEVLEICEFENRFAVEQKWIDKYNSFNGGYNSCSRAGFSEKWQLKKATEKRQTNRQKIKEINKKNILKLYHQVMSNTDISKKLKIDRHVVGEYLKEEGIINTVRSSMNYVNSDEKIYCYLIKEKQVIVFKNVYECSQELSIDPHNITRITNKNNILCKTYLKTYSFSKENLTVEQFEQKIKHNKRR